MSRPTWDELLDQMLGELQTGGPRAESYWAQQLAFGPVLVHALGLRLRCAALQPEHRQLMVACASLALAAFGSLPDSLAHDRTALHLLAARQARAIGWRRRATLTRLLERLGAPVPAIVGAAPSRMARPYPLIGFRPHERLAG